MKTRVLGVIGQIGSGKDTLAHLIETILGFTYLNISDFVRAEAAAMNIPSDRQSITTFSADMIARMGDAYFLDQVINSIESHKGTSFVVSGVRTESNIATFTKKFGCGFRLISIIVPDVETRYQRIRSRGGNEGPDSTNDLQLNDNEQERLFGLSNAMARADIEVANSGTVDQLATWVRVNASILKTQVAATSAIGGRSCPSN